jgi:small membrane protein
MLIQYILVLFSVALLLVFLRKRGTTKSAAGVKIAFLLFVLFGVYAVIRPEDVTVVAGWLGVGRGTDLLLYALVVVFTFATLNAYLRFKELELRYARLARAIALRQAEPPREPVDSDAA